MINYRNYSNYSNLSAGQKPASSVSRATAEGFKKKNMTKIIINSKIASIILIISLIGAIYLVEKETTLTKAIINNLVQEESFTKSILKGSQGEKISYLIDKGNGQINSYPITSLENSTVFSLLEELADRENFKIEFTTYPDMGVFVESIDKVKNGTNNKYWQYWVNGELPMIAADKKEVGKGDRVEWKFAPIAF